MPPHRNLLMSPGILHRSKSVNALAPSALLQNTERLLVLLASQKKKHGRKAHPIEPPLTEVTAPRLHHTVASGTVVTALK